MACRRPHNNFNSVYRIFTKLDHMIALWKGKNPIYFGVIRSKVTYYKQNVLPFDNLYRWAYFVMHTFLVLYAIGNVRFLWSLVSRSQGLVSQSKLKSNLFVVYLNIHKYTHRKLLPYTKYLNKKVSKKENFVYIFCGDKVFYFE